MVKDSICNVSCAKKLKNKDVFRSSGAFEDSYFTRMLGWQQGLANDDVRMQQWQFQPLFQEQGWENRQMSIRRCTALLQQEKKLKIQYQTGKRWGNREGKAMYDGTRLPRQKRWDQKAKKNQLQNK